MPQGHFARSEELLSGQGGLLAEPDRQPWGWGQAQQELLWPSEVGPSLGGLGSLNRAIVDCAVFQWTSTTSSRSSNGCKRNECQGPRAPQCINIYIYIYHTVCYMHVLILILIIHRLHYLSVEAIDACKVWLGWLGVSDILEFNRDKKYPRSMLTI